MVIQLVALYSLRSLLGEAGVGAIATCRQAALWRSQEAVLEEIEIGQHWSSTGNLFY